MYPRTLLGPETLLQTEFQTVQDNSGLAGRRASSSERWTRDLSPRPEYGCLHPRLPRCSAGGNAARLVAPRKALVQPPAGGRIRLMVIEPRGPEVPDHQFNLADEFLDSPG